MNNVDHLYQVKTFFTSSILTLNLVKAIALEVFGNLAYKVKMPKFLKGRKKKKSNFVSELIRSSTYHPLSACQVTKQ